MNEPVYEMLWDCRHCGQRKLLGLTHRHCPECGSPQNAEFRYFPAEQDKIAVHDHVYHGADIVCRYCGHYNGKNAKHCKDCGGPLAEGTAAQARQDQVHAIGHYQGENVQHAMAERQGLPPAGAPGSEAKPKKKRSIVPLLIGLGACTLLTVVLVVVFWKREASFTVQGHHWQRDVSIERFGPVKESAWCDALPGGAKNVKRYRATRSHQQVEVGEDCQTRKVDNGDGTFREVRECTPRFEKQPVEDDKCDFTLDKWSRSRTLTSKGSALSPEPSWPEVKLTRGGCAAVDCEREGSRVETYTVVFANAEDGDTGECTFDETKWKSFQPSASFEAEVGVVGGWLDCDTLSGK